MTKTGDDSDDSDDRSSFSTIFQTIFVKFIPRFHPFFGGSAPQTHPDALIAASNLAALLQEDGAYEESAEAKNQENIWGNQGKLGKTGETQEIWSIWKLKQWFNWEFQQFFLGVDLVCVLVAELDPYTCSPSAGSPTFYWDEYVWMLENSG